MDLVGVSVNSSSDTRSVQRIRKRSEYQRIQSIGKRFRKDHLIMLYTPSSSSLPRFGITVSRRVGNAVKRNRVKRWIREIIRASNQEWVGAWDVVIIAKPSAVSAGLVALKRDFDGFSSWISRKSQ